MNSSLAPATFPATRFSMDEVRRTLPSAAISFVAAVACSILAVAYVPSGWLREAAEALAAGVAAQPLADAPASDVAEGADPRARARTACGTCGVVDQVRRIDNGGLAATFEFTIRMRDGSTRTSSHASADSWRSGDRIMLIGGLAGPGAGPR